MKWSDLLGAVGSEPLFDSGMLLVGDVDPEDVRRQLSRWVRSGRLLQLRRGLYMFDGPDATGRRVPHPFEIANRLVEGSYVSLSSVLAASGLIPEFVPVTTSVTTGRPGRWTTPVGVYVYRHVKQQMFWGFDTLSLDTGGSAYVALPEKALVDLLYLEANAASLAYLEELRLQNMDRFRLDLLANMAEKCGIVRVQAAVRLVAELAEQERATFDEWEEFGRRPSIEA